MHKWQQRWKHNRRLQLSPARKLRRYEKGYQMTVLLPRSYFEGAGMESDTQCLSFYRVASMDVAVMFSDTK